MNTRASAGLPAVWIQSFAALAWFGLALQLPLTVGREMEKDHSIWWGLMMFVGYFTAWFKSAFFY